MDVSAGDMVTYYANEDLQLGTAQVMLFAEAVLADESFDIFAFLKPVDGPVFATNIDLITGTCIWCPKDDGGRIVLAAPMSDSSPI